MTVADFIVISMTILFIWKREPIVAVVLCVALLTTAIEGYKQHYAYNKYVQTKEAKK